MEQVQTEASKSGQMQEREPASAGQRQFLRTIPLLGEEGVARLRASHVAVFGLGGVGSFAAEALARAGVGTLTLVDADVVEATNLNRQLVALHSTLGMHKAEVMARRVADICPDTRVHAQAQGVPVVSSMGTGNKLDASALTVADIYETSVCPLARVMRRRLREQGVGSLRVVYSREVPRRTGSGAPASAPHVPPVAGMLLAGEVILDLSGVRQGLPEH